MPVIASAVCWMKCFLWGYYSFLCILSSAFGLFILFYLKNLISGSKPYVKLPQKKNIKKEKTILYGWWSGKVKHNLSGSFCELGSLRILY